MSFLSCRDIIAYMILSVRCLTGILRLNKPQTKLLPHPVLVNGSNEACSYSSWKPSSRAGFIICQTRCKMKAWSPSFPWVCRPIPCCLEGLAPSRLGCAQYPDPGWPRALHRGHCQPNVGTGIAPVMHLCRWPCLRWILDSCFPHLPHSLCHRDPQVPPLK